MIQRCITHVVISSGCSQGVRVNITTVFLSSALTPICRLIVEADNAFGKYYFINKIGSHLLLLLLRVQIQRLSSLVLL